VGKSFQDERRYGGAHFFDLYGSLSSHVCSRPEVTGLSAISLIACSAEAKTETNDSEREVENPASSDD